MPNKALKLDAIDIKILENLQKNAKLSAKELAGKLHLTPTPIYERISKLEKAGFISKYVGLLKPQMIECSVIVFINLTVKDHSKESRQQMIDQLLTLNEITELYNTSGTYDYIAKAYFKSIEAYRSFLVDRLSAIKNLGEIDSHIVLEEVRYTTELPVSKMG